MTNALRGGFDPLRTDQGNPQHIRLELQEEIVSTSPSVDFEFLDFSRKTAFHQIKNIFRLIRNRLQTGADDVAPVTTARQTADHSPGLRLPPRRAQSREGGNKINALSVVQPADQTFGVRGMLDDSQLIAEPLNHRPGDKNRTL